MGALLGIPALAYLLHPRNRPASASQFKMVARLNELRIGEPQQVVIRGLRRDAWTVHPDDVIGRVWLVRRDADQVDAFTTICPHLGCSINFEERQRRFLCPCHNGRFNMDGQRVEEPGLPNPAPRSMDRLLCRRDPANESRREPRRSYRAPGEHPGRVSPHSRFRHRPGPRRARGLAEGLRAAAPPALEGVPRRAGRRRLRRRPRAPPPQTHPARPPPRAPSSSLVASSSCGSLVKWWL